MTENTTPETEPTESVTAKTPDPYSASVGGNLTVGDREAFARMGELDATETTRALPTEWADAIPGNFDGDQSAIHAWVIATEEERAEVLANMRFADAEALVDAAAEVAKVHEDRAREARALGINVAKRLGREAQKLQTGTMPVTAAQAVAADTAALGVIK